MAAVLEAQLTDPDAQRQWSRIPLGVSGRTGKDVCGRQPK